MEAKALGKTKGFYFSIFPSQQALLRLEGGAAGGKQLGDKDRVYYFQVPDQSNRAYWLAALLEHGADLRQLRDSKGTDQICAYKTARSWLASQSFECV